MSARFKVLQFNMQYGQIWSDSYPDHAPVRIEATIAEILSHDADLVMLQEVELAMPGGLQLEQPPNYTELKRALVDYEGYFSYPKADPRELPFGVGLAIFSKTPLRDVMRLDLPSPPIEFDFYGKTRTPTDRLLVGATTSVGGREIRVYNTHLLAFFMLNTSEEHQGQRELVAKELGASVDLPTVLAGDFNVSKHDRLIEQFSEIGYNTVQATERTWRRRPFVLDHIFYNDWIRCVSHAVQPTPASDHHALSAVFEFTR